LNGSEIAFPEGVAYTQLFKSEEIQQQEETYLSWFSTADNIEMVKGKLHITCDDQVIIYHKK
jgi:ethanolamine utilization protein EutQ (cupin superfamily)